MLDEPFKGWPKGWQLPRPLYGHNALNLNDLNDSDDPDNSSYSSWNDGYSGHREHNPRRPPDMRGHVDWEREQM